jgi:hypothetical protein
MIKTLRKNFVYLQVAKPSTLKNEAMPSSEIIASPLLTTRSHNLGNKQTNKYTNKTNSVAVSP